MTGEYMTYEGVLRELQCEEEELDGFIAEGSLMRFETAEGPRYLRAQVLAIKEDLEAMKTIALDKARARKRRQRQGPQAPPPQSDDPPSP